MLELPIPESSLTDPKATELVRIWAKSQGQDFVINVHYQDPMVWGILIVDLIHQVSLAYEEIGKDPDETFRRILEGLRAELAHSTDSPEFR